MITALGISITKKIMTYDEVYDFIVFNRLVAGTFHVEIGWSGGINTVQFAVEFNALANNASRMVFDLILLPRSSLD